MSYKRLIYVMPLLLSLLACGYVNSQNLYQITDSEHQLLYNAAPAVSYTFTYDAEILATSGEEQFLLPLTGNGAIRQEEDEPVPDLQLVTEFVVENSTDETGNFQIEFRLIDSQVYLQATNLQTGVATDWATMSLGELFVGVGLDLPTGIFDFSTGQPIDPSIAESFDGSMGEAEDMDLSEYTHILRRSDDTIDGQHVAVFEIQVDEYEFLIANISAMLPLMDMMGLDEDFGTMDKALLEILVSPLVEQLFPEFEWTVQQYVSTETGNQVESKTSIYIELDSFMLASLAMPEEGVSDQENIGFDIYLDTRYDDYEENIEIPVPENAVPMSFDEFAEQTQGIVRE